MLGISGAACKKSDSDSGPTPAEAAFEQDFTLYYQQLARLPAAGNPELSVTVTELHYTFCPKNAMCLVADFVDPTLNITDAQGQTQQVTLPRRPKTTYNPAWIDTTNTRANARRYLLTVPNGMFRATATT